MKQIELTSKLVVALIAIVVFSAMTVPSVVAQSTTSPPIRANSVTSGSIKDGEVKTDDLADNAVTSVKIKNGEVKAEDIAAGVIPSGNIQPTVHIVDGPENPVEPGGQALSDAVCPDGTILTGGGGSASGAINVALGASIPWDENTWRAFAFRTTNEVTTNTATVHAWAVCLDFSP